MTLTDIYDVCISEILVGVHKFDENEDDLICIDEFVVYKATGQNIDKLLKYGDYEVAHICSNVHDLGITVCVLQKE